MFFGDFFGDILLSVIFQGFFGDFSPFRGFFGYFVTKISAGIYVYFRGFFGEFRGFLGKISGIFGRNGVATLSLLDMHIPTI